MAEIQSFDFPFDVIFKNSRKAGELRHSFDVTVMTMEIAVKVQAIFVDW